MEERVKVVDYTVAIEFPPKLWLKFFFFLVPVLD